MNSHPTESQHTIGNTNTAVETASLGAQSNQNRSQLTFTRNESKRSRRRLWIKIASLAFATSLPTLASAYEPPAPIGRPSLGRVSLGQSLRAQPVRNPSRHGAAPVTPATYHGYPAGDAAQPYHLQTYPASHPHSVYPLPIPQHRTCCGSGICTCNATPLPAEVAARHMASGLGKLLGIHQGHHGTHCDQNGQPPCDSAPWLENSVIIEQGEMTRQPTAPAIDQETPQFHPPLKPAPKQETPAPKQATPEPKLESPTTPVPSTTPMPPSLGDDRALPAPIRLDQNGSPTASPPMQESPDPASPKNSSVDKPAKPTQPFDALPSSMPTGRGESQPTPSEKTEAPLPEIEAPKQDDTPSSIFDALPTSTPDPISPEEMELPEPDFDSIFGKPQNLDDASSDSNKSKRLQVKPISNPLPSLNAPTGRQVSQVRLKSYRATAEPETINLARHHVQPVNQQAVQSANYLTTPRERTGKVRQASQLQHPGRQPAVLTSHQTVLAPYRR